MTVSSISVHYGVLYRLGFGRKNLLFNLGIALDCKALPELAAQNKIEAKYLQFRIIVNIELLEIKIRIIRESS